MAIDEWALLKRVMMQIHNRVVRADFRADIPDDDIISDEGAFRRSCLIQPNDSVDIVQLKIFNFYVVREQAKRLQAPMYAFPVEEFQEAVQFKPQLILEFIEPSAEARRKNTRPVTRRASYRLVNERSETITQSKIDTLQNRIRSQFPNSYKYKTGRYKASYRDKANGLELKMSPYAESDARDLVKRVLNVAAVTPNWDFFSISQYPDRNFNRVETVSILGKRTRLPQKRPIADVRFRRATLHIHGMKDSVVVDERYVP